MLRSKLIPTEVIIHRDDGSHCDTNKLVMGKRVMLYRVGSDGSVDDSIDMTRKEN